MALIKYYQLVNYLDTLQLPEDLKSKDQQKLKNKATHFLLKNKALYKRNKKNQNILLKVIRPNEVEKILFDKHATLTAGHFGIEVTYNRFSQQYYWSRMHLDIEHYIKTCDICQ